MVVNSLSLIEEEQIIYVKVLFLSKLDAIDNMVGLAPETLNKLAKLGEAMNYDSNFYNNLVRDLSFKANVSDVYVKTQVNTHLANKPDKADTYTKTEIEATNLATQLQVDTALTTKSDKPPPIQNLKSLHI
jgi:hypothetical protein